MSTVSITNRKLTKKRPPNVEPDSRRNVWGWLPHCVGVCCLSKQVTPPPSIWYNLVTSPNPRIGAGHFLLDPDINRRQKPVIA